MQIVIDIPDELYNHIKNDDVYYLEDDKDLYMAVMNGTPLPKGHGRLIDENQLIGEIRDDIVGNFDNLEWWLSAADTVIEADTEREVKE